VAIDMGSRLNTIEREQRETQLDYPKGYTGSKKVDLNNLLKKVKEEEKKSKRQNIAISAVTLSAVAVFGIILTL